MDRSAPEPGLASPLRLRQSLILLGALVLITVGYVALLAGSVALIPGARAVAVPVLTVGVLGYEAMTLVVLHVMLHRFGTGWHALGFRALGRRGLHLLWQVPAGLVIVVVAGGLSALLLPRDGRPNALTELGTSGGPVVAASVLVAAVVLTPPAEEAVFRGVVQGGLRRRFGPVIPAVVSAVVFAVAHGIPPLIPYYVVGGLILAFLREFHRSLWAGVVFHAALNLLASSALLAALDRG